MSLRRGLLGLILAIGLHRVNSLGFMSARGLRRCGVVLHAAPDGDERPETSLSEPLEQVPEVVPAVPEAEDVTLGEYVFGKPGELQRDLRLLGTSAERVLGATFLALVVALGGNLAGVTSALLSTQPVAARDAGLDLLFPVGGYKRYRDAEDAFEFVYPSPWLADQAVALARATARAGNPAEAILGVQVPKRARGVVPRAAFGPAGRDDALENVSVIKQGLMPGFTLEGTLGAPEEAAQKLLDTSIAPPGSGKDAKLVRAEAKTRNGLKTYEFEWTVEGALQPRKPGNQRFAVHTNTVITNRGDDLYTLAVIFPEGKWGPATQATADFISASFRFR